MKINKYYKYNFFKKNIITRVISKVFFFNIELNEIIEFNPIKFKLLKALSQYTGYSNINIIGKSIMKYNNQNLENKYNIFFSYVKFIYNKIINKKYIMYKYKEKNKKEEILSLNISKIQNKLDEFLKTFPFFFIKTFQDFLISIFELLKLKHYKLEYKYKLLADAFYYILEFYNGHFFRAFKFYKLFLYNIFNCNLINTYGIRIIVKGRFGKVRKQIERLVIGSLSLNSIINNVNYINNIINTKRGSYGFHIWFCEKKKKFGLANILI
jgi:hypothetical protein